MKVLILFLCSIASASAQCPNCSGVSPPNGGLNQPQCQYVQVCNQFGQCQIVKVCR